MKDRLSIDTLSSDEISILKERLLSRIAVVGKCWEWQGAKNSKGYGSISIAGNLILVHRLSYRAHIGKIGNSFVCHRCDNPKCINPAHLFLGTPAENARDMFKKGRGNPNPSRKISATDARSIRDKFATKKYKVTQLASEYGLAREYVHAILRGEYWPDAGGKIINH